MNQTNPAAPGAPASATPGSEPQVITTPPATTSNVGQGSEGTVTIPLKEYRNLQRGAARSLSFDKRMGLKNRSNNQSGNSNGEGGDEISKLSSERDDAITRALQLEVKDKVRDLLGKDEFKTLPASTRNLILERPHMLSDADNVDEALLDIEDFVRDSVLSMEIPAGTGEPTPASGKPNEPAGHETPPSLGGGTPAPAGTATMEDTANLSGPARSQAILRNSLKKAKGVK